jgi:hypothetical protein
MKHKVCFLSFRFFLKVLFRDPDVSKGTNVQGYQMKAETGGRSCHVCRFAVGGFAEAVSGPTSFLLAGKSLQEYGAKLITNCLL